MASSRDLARKLAALERKHQPKSVLSLDSINAKVERSEMGIGVLTDDELNYALCAELGIPERYLTDEELAYIAEHNHLPPTE